jgi:hypothetical protein
LILQIKQFLLVILGGIDGNKGDKIENKNKKKIVFGISV